MTRKRGITSAAAARIKKDTDAKRQRGNGEQCKRGDDGALVKRRKLERTRGK